MKRSFKRGIGFIISITVVLLSTNTLWAEDKRWADTAELSYVQTDGNTDVMTFSGNNDLKYKFSDQWAGSWKVGALSAATNGEKTAERYYTDLRADFKASDRIYLYGLGGWSQDKFAGIDTRYYLGPGIGYQILTGDHHFLSVEGGLSYAKEEYIDKTENDFLEGRMAGKYEYALNPKTKFLQMVEYLHNFDDNDKYHIKSTTAIITILTDMFSLKLAYDINYNNKPSPETLKQTDTIFSAALVANF